MVKTGRQKFDLHPERDCMAVIFSDSLNFYKKLFIFFRYIDQFGGFWLTLRCVIWARCFDTVRFCKMEVMFLNISFYPVTLCIFFQIHLIFLPCISIYFHMCNHLCYHTFMEVLCHIQCSTIIGLLPDVLLYVLA